jgi:tetratricopeptide (TPR) repeat protein
MKKVLFAFVLFIAATANAQSDKYVAVMQKNIALLDSAKTVQDFQSASNAFERIGDAEKTQWLPYYYSGLALSTIGWIDPKVDKDANSAKINALCDKAEAIEKNAEIYALRNMSATQQMLVDPQSRWQSYGQQAGAYLQEAMKLDPNNPRLYYLQAQSIFGTPEAFGGGKKNAKPLFEKAVALYKTYPVKPLYPNWGAKSAEMMLAKCE